VARPWKPGARKALTELCRGRKRAPSLDQLARFVNSRMDGYSARVRRTSVSTDRKVGRIRYPGAGRTGNRITVTHDGKTVIDHNAAETYRYNGEVVQRLAEILEDPKHMRFLTMWSRW